MIYDLNDISDKVKNTVNEFNSVNNDENKIQQVNLFGSYANGNADEDSDVDLYVKFGVPCVSLFTLAKAREAFENSLSKSIDLVQDPLPENALLSIDKKVLLYG